MFVYRRNESFLPNFSKCQFSLKYQTLLRSHSLEVMCYGLYNVHVHNSSEFLN